MIEDFDIKVFTSLHYRPGDCHIIRTWRGITRGVIVSANDSRSIHPNCGPKNLSYPYLGRVETAVDYFNHIEDVVAGIKRHNNEKLLLPMGKEWADEIENISRAVDAGPGFFWFQHPLC